MGAACPLPERIPIPSDKCAQKMKSDGIVLNNAKNSERYITYVLPTGWDMVDCSWREDLPIWHIVDQNDMKRYSITGAWKGAYDNALEIHDCPGDEKIERTIEPAEPSETSPAARVAEAVDPRSNQM